MVAQELLDHRRVVDRDTVGRMPRIRKIPAGAGRAAEVRDAAAEQNVLRVFRPHSAAAATAAGRLSEGRREFIRRFSVRQFSPRAFA